MKINDKKSLLQYSQKENIIRVFLLIASLLTLIIFYLPMMKNYFLSDDPFLIWASATHSFKEFFFVPQRYMAVTHNFTPMLMAAFSLDWILFGINPIGYSLHSLISLIGTAIVFYLFLRLYVNGRIALVGVLLLLLNPITLALTSWFSARHYIEGLFWALLSLYFFVSKEREGKVSVLTGIFYIFASLNKEVYVILPAVAFIIASEGFLKRLKHTLPLWIGFEIYSIWRLWIMGGIGGYLDHPTFNLNAFIATLYKSINSLSFYWFGNYHILLYLFVPIAIILSLKNIKMLIVFLILVIPIIPVSNIFEGDHLTSRYLFHISVFLICAVCILMEIATATRWKIRKGAVLLAVLLIAALSIRQDIKISNTIRHERLKSKETAMEFIYSQKGFIKSEQPYWFYRSLMKINKRFLGRDIKTQFVPYMPFLKYADHERLKEIRAAGIAIPYDKIMKSQERFREGPITIRMTLENYRLTWDFGPPDREVLYTLLLSWTSGLYYDSMDLRPSGTYILGKDEKNVTQETVYIRIFYLSRDGSEVISPEFALKIPGSQKIEYSNLPSPFWSSRPQTIALKLCYNLFNIQQYLRGKLCH